MTLHAPLLFTLSHYTEAVIEDLESRKRDALEQTLYTALLPTIQQVTPFDVFSRITDTLIRFLEHDRPMVRHRMTEIIKRIIALRPQLSPAPSPASSPTASSASSASSALP